MPEQAKANPFAFRADISGSIQRDLVNFGLDDDTAERLIAAIKKGEIEHLYISY